VTVRQTWATRAKGVGSLQQKLENVYTQRRHASSGAARDSLGVALAAAIGATYFGHSPGPYGNCFGPSGRPVPCTIVARTLTAKDSTQLFRALRGAKR